MSAIDTTRMNDLLSTELVERILARGPALTVGVVGDLFLDRYLDLDATLTEPSLETGLDAYQVVGIRPSPGAAGTVINNLVALGIGRVCPVAVLGADGEGYELRKALSALPAVDLTGVFDWPGRYTPTYTKPMLHVPGQPARELNRLDTHNRSPLPAGAEARVLEHVEAVWRQADALVVLDQVSGEDCGVVTARVRDRLAELGGRDPDRWCLADSRARIGRFRAVCLKPNQRECLAAVGGDEADLASSAARLARQSGRTVFCTRAEKGLLVAGPVGEVRAVGAFTVSGPIDPVGAGDSTSAGIVGALAAGATPDQAAAFGALVASITVQQLGTTGTATPAQVRQRWGEVSQG